MKVPSWIVDRILDTPQISAEAVVQRCSLKKGVLKNFGKINTKTPGPGSLFNKVAGLRPATLLKK